MSKAEHLVRPEALRADLHLVHIENHSVAHTVGPQEAQTANPQEAHTADPQEVRIAESNLYKTPSTYEKAHLSNLPTDVFDN
jgi:hypothetical protein